MSINLNGLTAISTGNATWASPLANEMPVAVASQIRGGLWLVSGAEGDQLTNIPGIMLQDGMLVYLQAEYEEPSDDTIVRAGNRIYQFTTDQDRPANGILTNEVGNWAVLATGGGDAGAGGFRLLDNTLDMNNNMQGAGGVVQLGPEDNDNLFFITDATNLNGATVPAPANSPAPTNAAGVATPITNLPGDEPVGGYTNAFNAVVAFEWNEGGAQRWVFQRLLRANPDAAYVNVTGDTMTGNLVMDDDADDNDVGIHFTDDNRGDAGNPAIAFEDAGGNFDTGIYQGAVDEIDFACGGRDALQIANNDLGAGEQETVLQVQDTLVLDTPEVIFPVGPEINPGTNDGPAAEVILIGTDDAANRNPRAITIQAPVNRADFEENYTLTLPHTDGDANQFLQTNGEGVLTWAVPTGAVEAYTTITDAWNLANDRMVQIVATGQTVPVPTNRANGQCGLLLINPTLVNPFTINWPAAGGDVFQYAGGAVPNITQFPAVVPYTVITVGDNTQVLWGTPTVNIT